MGVVRKYIGENYDSIIEIAKVITKGHAPDFEDLAHEVILMVLEADEEKMSRIIEKKQMNLVGGWKSIKVADTVKELAYDVIIAYNIKTPINILEYFYNI